MTYPDWVLTDLSFDRRQFEPESHMAQALPVKSAINAVKAIKKNRGIIDGQV